MSKTTTMQACRGLLLSCDWIVSHLQRISAAARDKKAQHHEFMDLSSLEGDLRSRGGKTSLQSVQSTESNQSEEEITAMVALAESAVKVENEYVIGGLALCKEQLAELREIFTRFDRDQDGSITELELGLMLRSLGLKPEGHQLDALLQRGDTNSNGTIEFTEFVALIGPQLVKTEAFSDKELLAVFRAFDRDGNGFITAAELAHSMAKLGQALSVKELWTMIREADSDGDGRISFSEFAAAMLSAKSLDIPH